MTTRWEPALRLIHRFALRSGERVFEVATLRRPELVLRFTACRRVAVDERLLARSFPLASEPSRLLALVMVDGSIELEHGGVVRRGESVLLDRAAFGTIRSKDACHLDLEWASNAMSRYTTPHRLGNVTVEHVMKIADALLDRDSDQRSTFANAFELFRSIGAPLTSSVEALEGEPTEQDRRLAQAMEEQLDNLTSQVPTAFHLGDSMRLSERHINRLVEDFNVRYGVNAHNWRDARNRWRVQNAVLLLSRPELTVAEVAGEVGYASPNALARALSRAGFPPPAVLRQRMSEMDPFL